MVESLKIITEKASTRIAKYAFDLPNCITHKGNGDAQGKYYDALDGLFLECFYNVSKDFPEITADDKIIDNACMQRVMRPENST